MRRLAPSLLALTTLLIAGCASRPTTVPIATERYPSSCPAATRTLLVLLPGVYSDPKEFAQEGFVDAVRERGLAVDVVGVDAHLGYYEKGIVIERLRTDVIAPAQAQGYSAIWVLGISLGGFGGMLYAQERPGELAGLVALAPYLGERATSTEIDNAGGLARWQAPVGSLDLTQKEPREQALWRWLQGYSATAQPSARPPMYLGYGVGDRFRFSHRLLAATLPPERVFTTEGGHDWPQWRRLWRAVLPTLPLPAC